MGKPRHGRFSDKRYAMPFGRYVGSSEVEPPADEVLVGRESQRAYLIDLLISTGRRGAYLVTGQRGVGKTSFVQHCIGEYEASVFGRFLRGNLGRSFWDRIFVLLFWLAILLGALLTSEVLQIFVVSREWNALRWVILAPLGVILLYPCVYAKVVLEIVQQAAQDLAPPPKRRWPTGVFAATAVICLCAFFWFVPGFEEPVSVISFLIPITGGMYLLAQTVSFVPPTAQTGRSRTLISWGFAVVFALLIFYMSFLCREELVRFRDIFAAQLGLGLMLLGFGCIFRGVHQRLCEDVIKSRCSKDNTDQKIRESFTAAMASGTRWYVAVGIALAAFGAWLYFSLRPSMTGPMLLLLIAFLLWRLRQGEGRQQRENSEKGEDGQRTANVGQSGSPEDKTVELIRFRPRPDWVLSIKAVASIVVALQLAHPFLSRAFSQLSEFMRPFLPLALSDLLKFIRSRPQFCDLAELRGLCTNTSEYQALHQIGTPNLPLFSTSAQEVWWLLGTLTLLIIFQFIEYEWIIRPFIRSREEYIFAGSSLAPWDDWENDTIPAQDRRRVHLSLAELTLPWVVFRSWLPVLPVSVNLGFDRLDHRQVIQAMLVGLRERYKRTFLAWNSGFANLGRFLGLLSLLALMTLTTSSADSSLHQSWTESLKEGFGSPTWASILNNDLFFREIPQGQPTDLLLFHLLPSERRVGSNPYLHFSVYHALVLAAFFLLGQWLLHRLPILPFKENLRRVEDMLDSLSTRTRVTSKSYLWGPARWAHSIFSDERVRETEREPVDPRTVELAFLQILEDIQKGGFRLPGAARDHLTLPAPEITFVFDELDKLGTRADVVSETRAPSSPEQVRQMLYSERERSLKIRALLSDLKNIIASAPARFIFVGGRDLHDEWLADHTSRQPLLSSIFNTEVYLPSLLTDHAQHPTSGETRLHQQVKLYIEHQYERALYLSQRSVRKRWLPPFGLFNEATSPERFASTEPTIKLPPVFDCETGRSIDSEGAALLRDFTLFLTHRSMGNPKKLKDLLLSFIRPAGREIDPKIRWGSAPCRHIISFSDTDIFRIQLMVDIYRHLCLAFETKMVHRDDKFAISIFFMTDFLFKFHRRAFSWSNLERVDDLAHIHRLPDLRDVQEEIVDHFSERFLHRVFNGIYSFRFRSDIAREVEYLSRRSATEMAAFNFTLDESQSLKAEYAAALKSSEGGNPDLVAALGELYEFDQDFERARYQYRLAIDLMDDELSKSIEPASPILTRKLGTPVLSILDGTHGEYARLFVSWGVARLRLMLQIGMTYEHERDQERAEAEYRSARTLARALVRAYVDRIGRGEEPLPDVAQNQRKQRLHTLKHLNIVFQPIFAEAWISEKFVGSIDTSTSLVEKALWEIRRSLPFVRDPKLPNVADIEIFRSHANFALTISQLHNKAGDLYFFKGRQPTTTQRIQEILKTLSTSKNVTDRSTEGYLLRAHYHYAVALHELRRYVSHRVARSQFWLSIAREQTQTLLGDALPDFLFRAAGGGVSDMAEATLARVSLFELLNRLKWNAVEWQEKDIPDLKEYFLEWLGIEKDTEKSKLANWFGWWKDDSPYDNEIDDLIDFLGPDTADSRLLMSLKLCLVGADLLEDAGYPEDAGRELLQVCETVTRYIWWGHTVETLSRWFPVQTSLWNGHGPEDPLLLIDDIFTGSNSATLFWSQLVDMAIEALKRADKLFRQSRSQNSSEKSAEMYIVGTIIPTEAATLLCSLGMAGRGLLPPQKMTDLRKLLLTWTREPTYDFSDALRLLIQRHRYPMINRLNGLKILIDDLILREVPFTSSEEDFDQAILWTEELLDLNTQFDAPLHFTPFHSGVTCALVWLWASQEYPESSVQRIYRAANSDLDRSEEMYTMRRGYYEAISGLYYLYDDFNDRQIHYNHAIQMAGSELTAILKHLVERFRPT